MKMMPSINRANTNSLWSSVFVECLARCGLKHVVISPGSRSAPLTVAFAAHPAITAVPVLDERSAGFFALGLAKQTHRPVALVCTSGTAAVNYFPAVVEASESRVPLLVLTADRPPELRNCGAGQTINQIRLYGEYPVFQAELDMPACGLEMLQKLKGNIVVAYGKAIEGPVHLNVPFRDPLPPVDDGSTKDAPEIAEDFFSDTVHLSMISGGLKEPISISTGKGIIICGTEMPKDPAGYCQNVAKLSKKCGWPVLADGLSPVRNYAALQKRLITCYDLLLRNSELEKSLQPECVIALGPLPTSKELRRWLSDSKVDLYHVHRTGKNLDPTDSLVQVVEIDDSQLDSSFEFQAPGDFEYEAIWRSSQARALGELIKAFSLPDSDSFEGKIAWMLPQVLPEKTPLFVASSMPVRDVEYFWPPNDRGIQVYSSRGVNGIDGTLSTALGIAHGNRPSVLLTGDLAFLHDSNGLLIRPKFDGHLTVILINNQGGGIFNHLPISKFEPPFEEFFATPQEVDFKGLVESTGCSYVKLDNISELSDWIGALPELGIRVIEIETDRHWDAEYRKSLFKSICKSLS